MAGAALHPQARTSMTSARRTGGGPGAHIGNWLTVREHLYTLDRQPLVETQVGVALRKTVRSRTGRP